MPFFSIQLNSNRPGQIVAFFDNVEATADNPEDIEILLHIDLGDAVMENLAAEEKKKRRFIIRTLKTDLVKGYSTLWKPLNPLWEMTAPDVYFVINLSDEMLFETKGWDSYVRRYEGYYPDHIFRLRGSQYRFRNYTDFWECGFAPDSLAFYTRRWLELSGDWNPCLGPDSFQQCVAFHLFTSDPLSHTQHNRDIPLTGLKFSGEGAGIGLEGIAKYRRIVINNRAWFVLMSHQMQQEARRRAMRMKANIIALKIDPADAPKVVELPHARKFVVTSKNNGKILFKADYSLSRMRITLINLLRMWRVLYFAGGGRNALRYPIFGLLLMVTTYLPRGGDLLFKTVETSARLSERKHKLRRQIRSTIGAAGRYFGRGKSRLMRLYQCWSEYVTYVRKRPLVVSEPSAYKDCKITIRLGQVALNLLTILYHVTLGLRRALPLSFRKGLVAVRLGALPWIGLLRTYVRKHLYNMPSFTIVVPSLRGISKFRIITLQQSLERSVVLFINLLVIKVGSGGRRLYRKVRSLRFRPRRSPSGDWEEIAASTTDQSQPLESRIVFSIQVASKSTENILELIDNIEKTASDPKRIEILVHIDAGNEAMDALLKREQARSPMQLRYIKTDISKNYADRWKACNALFELTDKSAYFVSFINDRMRFECKGWDSHLMEYIGYYSDHIFRVRVSGNQFRNYVDYWECGFAPAGLTFCTRQWIAIQGTWTPCVGPDAFQQCVSYYLFTSDPFSHVQYHRDLVSPFIKASNRHACLDKNMVAKQERRREWLVLISHQIQQDAKRRAMQLKLAIKLHEYRLRNPEQIFIAMESRKSAQFCIRGQHGELIEELSYKVSRLRIHSKTFIRSSLLHRYADDGLEMLRAEPWNDMKIIIDPNSPSPLGV